eukprot:8160431-Ditylum_brightwellii.AAC.1
MAILQHLYATYGRITPSILEENNRAMKKDYDATLPIEHLAKQIETAVVVAGNANQPYTAAQGSTKMHARNGGISQQRKNMAKLQKVLCSSMR